MPSKKTPTVTLVTEPNMGQLIDEIALLQQERDAYKEQVNELEKKIAVAVERLETRFNVADLNGATGAIGRAERKQQIIYSAKDWTKVYAYIKKHNAFELLQKRLTSTAVNERFEAGKPIDGIERGEKWYTVVTTAKASMPSLRARKN